MTVENVFDSEETKLAAEKAAAEAALQPEIEKLKERSVDELAKKSAHADQFIEFLKSQNDELKKDNENLRVNVVLEEHKEKEKKSEAAAQSSEAPTGTELTAEAIKSLVSEAITSQSTEAQTQLNIGAVDAEVKKQFGEKAGDFMQRKSGELGLSLVEMQDVAAKSPAAFYNLVGLAAHQAPTNQDAPTRGTVIPETLMDQNQSAPMSTYKDFQSMKKDNPTLYWSSKVQQEMHKAAQRADAEGRDFYS